MLRQATTLATLVTLGLVGWYVVDSREASAQQRIASIHAQNTMAMSQLVQELGAMAQRDASITPLLARLSTRTTGQGAGSTNSATPNRR
jgi:hypothetical protein